MTTPAIRLAGKCAEGAGTLGARIVKHLEWARRSNVAPSDVGIAFRRYVADVANHHGFGDDYVISHTVSGPGQSCTLGEQQSYLVYEVKVAYGDDTASFEVQVLEPPEKPRQMRLLKMTPEQRRGLAREAAQAFREAADKIEAGSGEVEGYALVIVDNEDGGFRFNCSDYAQLTGYVDYLKELVLREWMR